MAKPKFGGKIDTGGSIEERLSKLTNHVQSMTDNLKFMLNGQLNIVDNLQQQYVTLTSVNSGQEYSLTSSSFKPKGALIVETNSNTVTSFKTRIGQGNVIFVTVAVSPSPAQLTFLLIGE